MPLELNSLLHKRYRILERLGSGGMGEVYRGNDESLGVEVAIKENLFVSPEAGRQFEREARLLASLRHPGLPRVTDHFVIQGQGQYLVMDFVPGEDAQTKMEDQAGPLPEHTVLQWAQEISDALEYMHARPQPIIHRDIKPGNIKITPMGKAVLVDFGLAKKHDPTKTTTLGARALTPGFAPPEQYGHGRTDTRTDVFSFGATLYALLTGAIPADSIKREMGIAHLTPMREINPHISAHIASAIERALQTNPDARFQSIKEFKQAMFPATKPVSPQAAPTIARAAIQPTVRADAVPRAEPPRPTIRRERKLLTPILALLVGAFTIGFVAILVLPRILSGPSDRATPGPPTTDMTSSLLATTEAAYFASASETPSEPEPTSPPAADETEQVPVAERSPTPFGTPIGGGGGQIAFAREPDGLPQVFIMNLDGSDQQQITTLPDGACQPAWSPDGGQLLFVSPCNGKKDAYPNAVIFIMNPDGSDIRPFITLIGGVYDPAWSPSGILFTYLENNRPGVWHANSDGSNTRRISGSNAFDRQPTWSPLGDKLALLNTSRSGSPVIYWFNQDGSFDGSVPDQVTRDQVVRTPAWSPSGELIAYAASNHIWVIKWDGKGYGGTRLTDTGPNDDPAWSPDGGWIVFESWRDDANHDIYIMTANGGMQTRLTDDPALEYHPAWQP
ncbi:MAG: protein kinase [Anaerolineales bacterium]|nr:protein kinase [Anaerolineales bacterium]